MIVTVTNTYAPDYIVCPGEILEEHLEARGMKKTVLAGLCGRTEKTISQIISGKAQVTPELAIQFQRILGTSAELWNNLEACYRLELARRKERDMFVKQQQWAIQFPIKELVNRGFMPKSLTIAETPNALLTFLGAGSPAAWKEHYNKMAVNFRRSATLKSDAKAVAVWLRIGELKAGKVQIPQYDEAKFKLALDSIRQMIARLPSDFSAKMRQVCAEAGVILVFESEIKGTSLSGATCWLKNNPIIMLSLRHKSDDHFWFSFFHEAAHILKHGKKLTFIDLTGNVTTDPQEIEANQFAGDFLIPPKVYADFISRGDFSSTAIQQFAKKVGTTAGIVVGRLQWENKLPWNTLCNGLKIRIDFAPAQC